MNNILVVDEDPQYYKALKARLEALYDCKVHPAGRLVLALEEIEQQPNKFDLIILDLELPDTTNVEALLALRPAAQHIPLLAVAHSKEPLLLVRSFAVGADEFLTKDLLADNICLKDAILFAIEKRKLSTS